MEVAFKGTHFHGWQIQANAKSIQSEIQKALSTVLRSPIEITGCGRTDTGVHALQHFSHFLSDRVEFGESILYQLNSILPDDICIRNIFPVHSEAHARFDAISREYEYRLYFEKDPFLKDFATYCHRIPRMDLMKKGAEILQTYQDFTCFSKTHTQVKTNLCKIQRTDWEWRDGNLVFTIQADRFLRNMVRAIVGTLLLVGWEEMDFQGLREVLESKDRGMAGPSVSPDGLYLKKVIYPFRIPNPNPLRTH